MILLRQSLSVKFRVLSVGRKQVITIAHCDSAIAQEQKSNIELSQTDRSLRGIAKVEQKMMTGATGYGTYMKGGTLTIQAYAPIEGTNGWSVAVNAPLTDFLRFYPLYVLSLV